MSFTKAANKLFVTQQVISNQVRNLEKEIDLQLLSRSTKKVALTESGSILFKEWKNLIERSDKALIRASEVNKGLKRKIRIGLVEMSKVIDFISIAIAKYSEDWQDVDLQLEIWPFKKLQEQLRIRDLDLIVTLRSDLGPSSVYQIQTLLELHLSIVLSKHHPLARKESLGLKDLENETFFIFSNTYAVDAESKIIARCKHEGFIPKNIKYFDNVNIMEMALCSCKGVAIIFSEFFRNQDEPLKIYPLEMSADELNETLVAAWRKDKRRDIIDFIDLIAPNK